MSSRKFKRSRKSRKQAADPITAEQIFIKGNEYKRMGNLAEAESCFRKAIKLFPEHGQAWNNLGNLLHSQKKITDALTCYKRCCEILTDNAVCHHNYGSCLHETGNSVEGEKQLVRAVELNPEYSEAFIELGVVRRSIGDTKGAARALHEALRLEPTSCTSHRVMGLILKDQGKMDAAQESLRKGLEYSPDDAITRYLLTRYKKYTSINDPDITTLHSLLRQPDLTNENATFLHFGLGKIYDDLAMHKEAFHHYHLANRLKRDSLGVGWISTGIELNRYRKTFQPTLFRRFAQPSDSVLSELPVFIVGMPRSGTTLVEQICASHSLVHGKGELKKIPQLILNLPKQCKGKTAYPECLLSASPSLIRSLAEKYVAELKAGLPEETTRIIDKMPSNFQELGLISILFPRARLIHCVRDPLDTCLSNYFQNFEEGNECSYDMETISLYYRKYQAIMHHWETLLPDSIHTVQYELLVSNPEKETKALIDFLGLEWEEDCLNFHKTKRSVQTSSDWQVRQPIYKQSVARWKNYEAYIGELVKGLESENRLI